MVLSTLLLAAAPAAAPSHIPILKADPDPRSPAIVQEFLDEIAPRLTKPANEPFDRATVNTRQQKLDQLLHRVETESAILNNVRVSLRDPACFMGECAKLNYVEENDRKELLRIVDKAFWELGLYGDSFGWGNYPRPDVSGKKTSANLSDLIWLNWSACQGRGDPFNRMWCTNDHNSLFFGPVSHPDPPFYVMFQTEKGRVSLVKVVFERKDYFEDF